MEVYALVHYRLKGEDRICGQCGLREVDNLNTVLRCGGLVRERKVLMKNGKGDSWI